jgi:hypothetical protein
MEAQTGYNCEDCGVNSPEPHEDGRCEHCTIKHLKSEISIRDFWLEIQRKDLNRKFAPGKPIHEHDCDRCEYMGSIHGADIYVCSGNRPNLGSMVVRTSSHCSEYWSSPISMLDRSDRSWQGGLAIFGWNAYQEKLHRESGRHIQDYCDFINSDLLYKMRFDEYDGVRH